MKKLTLYISMLAIALGFLTACDEEKAMPPVPPIAGGFESLGDGSWEKPLTAEQCRLLYPGEETPGLWVTGYIVGWLDNSASSTYSLEEKSARIGTEWLPASAASNLLLSVYPPEEKEVDKVDPDTGEVVLDDEGNPVKETITIWPEWTEVCTVQLSYDSEVRKGLNLQNNPGVIGKQVSIYGTSGRAYCGVGGVRDALYYQWGDKGYYIDPTVNPNPDPEPEVIEDATFTKVTAMDGDGQYLMVFNGNLLASAIQPESKNYGALPVSTVEVNGDQITTSTLNSFRFTAAGEGYTIKDAYGRYLWRDPAFTNAYFQVTVNPTNGDVWTVTPQADGTFVIKNVLMNYFIQYSSTFDSIGSYLNPGGPLPVLYKRNN